MDSFIIIIILYIVLYIILSVINAINQKKKRELLKEKREEEIFEEEERKILPPILEKKFKIEKKEDELKENLKEPGKIEIYETKTEETKEQEVTQSEKEKLIIEEISPYKKIPKLKKILSLTRNDILKGIIFKEILTPKFKNKL